MQYTAHARWCFTSCSTPSTNASACSLARSLARSLVAAHHTALTRLKGTYFVLRVDGSAVRWYWRDDACRKLKDGVAIAQQRIGLRCLVPACLRQTGSFESSRLLTSCPLLKPLGRRDHDDESWQRSNISLLYEST